MRLSTPSYNARQLQRKLYRESKAGLSSLLKGLRRIAIGEPCVGKLQARFDEGALETCGGRRRGAPAPHSVSVKDAALRWDRFQCAA